MGPLIQAAIPAVTNAGGNMLKTATGDGNFNEIQDAATATNAAPETAQQGANAVTALPASNQAANEGLDVAARIESKVGEPVGTAIKDTGMTATPDARKLIDETHNDYNAAVQGAIKATTNAEAALSEAKAGATIDPERYLKNLGVSGGLMSAIGMALSGIGAATGQSNLAFAAYQKNVDRDINAQAQTFKNMMEISAQSQGLIKTAQDKQQIAANAYNMAVMSVATGANVALQGAATQIKSASAPYVVEQLKMMNDKMLSEATDRHSKDFSSTVQSGNTGRTNLLGDGTKAILDKITGKPVSPGRKGYTPTERTGRPGNGVMGSDTQASNDIPTHFDAKKSREMELELQLRREKRKAEEEAIRDGFRAGPQYDKPMTQANDGSSADTIFNGDSSKSAPKPFLDAYEKKK